MSVYITNALPSTVIVSAGAVRIQELTLVEARSVILQAKAISAVGHQDTAQLFSAILGFEVGFNRITVPSFSLSQALESKDKTKFIVAGLYKGPRLPERVHRMPSGGEINWYFVGPMTEYKGSWDSIFTPWE